MKKTILIIAVTTLLFSWTTIHADHHHDDDHEEDLKILSIINNNNKPILNIIEELEKNNSQVIEFEFMDEEDKTLLEITYLNKGVIRERLIDPAAGKTIKDKKLNFVEAFFSDAEKPENNKFKISKAFRHGEEVTGAMIIEGEFEEDDSFYFYSFKGIKDNKPVKIMVDPISLKTIITLKKSSDDHE